MLCWTPGASLHAGSQLKVQFQHPTRSEINTKSGIFGKPAYRDICDTRKYHQLAAIMAATVIAKNFNNNRCTLFGTIMLRVWVRTHEVLIHLNSIWWIIYGRRSFTIRCKYHQIKYKASPKPSNERYHSRLSRLTHAFPDVGQIVEHGVDRVNCRFRLMSAKSSVTRFWSTCCSIASDHLD